MVLRDILQVRKFTVTRYSQLQLQMKDCDEYFKKYMLNNGFLAANIY